MRNWAKFNDEQKLHMLKTIDWDADRMNRLLKDLLDLSRLEAGRLELKKQDVDVGEIAFALKGDQGRAVIEHAPRHGELTGVPG